MPTDELFGKKLRRAIETRWRGSLTSFAKELGITRQSLSQYLTGSAPRPAVIYQIATLLDIPLEWLLSPSGSEEPPTKRDRDEQAVSTADTVVLRDEVARRAAHADDELFEIAERVRSVDWPSLAIWLLRRQEASELPDAEQAAIELWKESLRAKADWEWVTSSQPIQRWTLREPRRRNADALQTWFEDRSFTAINYYLTTFDDDFVRSIGGVRKALGVTKSWDDRRAWLVAPMVLVPSKADDSTYEAMREHLRAMGYIVDGVALENPQGQQLEHEFGEFKLPPPITGGDPI
ncbi:MAG: helix-turn-helix transcriptional regulator [Planctomycetota bacterium]